MKDKILLSIVIPVYKVEKYLDKCIQSIINQDISNCEILLIDDGSPDECGNICDSYANKYWYISSYHKKNGGLSDARNYGINKCKGKYIWFIDSDDYIKENSISELKRIIRKDKYDVIVIQSKTIDDNNIAQDEKKYTIKKGVYSSSKYMEQLKTHPESVIFCAQFHICRKKFIDRFNLRFMKGIIHEDELWTPQLLINAHTIYYSALNIYYHYMRDDSIMHASNKKWSGECDLIVAAKLKEIFDKSGRKDLVYMRDNMVDIFFQAAWKLPDFKKRKKWNRFIPIINSYYRSTRQKALIYAFCPRLYLKIRDIMRKI